MEVKRKEKEMLQTIWQKERDQEIEKLVLKKMAMERVRQEEELLEEMLRKKQIEI